MWWSFVRRRVHDVGVSVLLLSLTSLVLALDTATAQTKSKSLCAFVLRKTAVYGSVIVGALSMPTGYHNWNASLSGERHLKFGISLDTQNIIHNILSAEERAIVLKSDRDSQTVRQIAGVLATKLHGDYVERYEILPSPRKASTYFEGQSDERGQCRHKACVLVGLLNDLGIRAHEAYATIAPTNEGHTFVILPDYDLVAEPTWASLAPTAHVIDLKAYEDLLASTDSRRTYDETNPVNRAVDLWMTGLAR